MKNEDEQHRKNTRLCFSMEVYNNQCKHQHNRANVRPADNPKGMGNVLR